MKDVESQGKWFGFLWSALCPQWGDHHIRCISEEGLNPSLYDLGLEWSQVDTLPHHDQLIALPSGGPPLAPSTKVSTPSEVGTAMPHQQKSSCTTLVVDHGMERRSIALSWITLIILPIVQVSTTKGTLCPNSDSSGTIRNTVSSSYPAIPHTCTYRITTPSGLVHFLPNPIRFSG